MMDEIDVIVLSFSDKGPVFPDPVLGGDRSKSRSVSAIGLRVSQISA